MSTPAAIRGPCLRSFTLGAALVFAALPGRVLAQEAASDPASSLASAQVVTEQAPYTGFLSEPRLLSKSINLTVDLFGDSSTRAPKSGVFLETSNMITGAGWIAVGPGYRRALFNRHALVETSAAISWRYYKMAQGRFEFTRLANDRLVLGSQVMWRDMTQVQYFGIGADSLEELRSQYRMKTTNVVGYARVRSREWLTIGGDIGYLRRPTMRDTSGWFERDVPTTYTVFPTDPAVTLAVQPNFVHGGLSITADTRDYRGHPTSGGVYRAAWTTFRDQDTNTYTFRRYEAEAAHFVPLADRQWVFAFRGWAVVSDVADDREVPFYLMPSLGGNNTIRAYSDYRFHDRNMVVINAESRWALFSHVDLAAFFDAGNVARHARDLNFDKTAYGIGIRLHTQRTTLGRIEFARGNGGWNVIFRTSDPLHLRRLSRRVAPVPFVP
jgi:hypothetical protein